VTVWNILGWMGDGEYHSNINWIPLDPHEVENCDYVYVDVYVDSDYQPNNNGADYICGDAYYFQ